MLLRSLNTGRKSQFIKSISHFLTPFSSPYFLFRQKALNKLGDAIAFLFEREMPCVEQVKFDIFQVALEWLRTFRRKNLIVLSPHDARRRLVFAEVLMPPRVKRRIRAVIEEQLELNRTIGMSMSVLAISFRR